MEVARRGIINELHKPARKHFTRRKVYVKGIDDLWQADLCQMDLYARFNKGNKYILTVIDVLSKYAWAVPVRDKKGSSVTAAMRTVLKQSHPRVPANLQCDNGTEFYNKEFRNLMNEHSINLYSTFTHLKASVVERFNRTLKSWLWKEFSLQGNYKWLALLPQLLKLYNARVHRSTGMRPKDVTVKHEKHLKNKLNPRSIPHKLKFKINDTVRVSKYKTLFTKGYTPSWSTELFTIYRVKPSSPPVYYLRDLKGDDIKGSFYEAELQKTNYPDTYLVEKILRRKGKKMYVKWLGMNSRSWI